MKKYNVCILGFGSIGKRHYRVIKSLGHQITVVSSQNLESIKSFKTLEESFELEEFDLIVIATPTANHSEGINALEKLNFKGIVLVEKPLVSSIDEVKNLQNLPFKIKVGYNLRFHPLIIRLKNELSNDPAISASIYTGQYLPSWRPDKDYRKSYSSHSNQGGGVLRDLSHELDYILQIFGEYRGIFANIGTFSNLQISSEDTVNAILCLEYCPSLSLSMNYNDRTSQRKIIVNTNENTYIVDLVKNTYQKNDNVDKVLVDRDTTYSGMHSDLFINRSNICSLNEGIDVMSIIFAIEESSEKKIWVTNSKTIKENHN